MSSGGYSIAPSPNYAAYANPNFGQQLGQIIANYPADYMQGRANRQQIQAEEAFKDPKEWRNPDGSPNVDKVVNKGAEIGGLPYVQKMFPFLNNLAMAKQDAAQFDALIRALHSGGAAQPPGASSAGGSGNVTQQPLAPPQPRLSSAGADNKGTETINSRLAGLGAKTLIGGGTTVALYTLARWLGNPAKASSMASWNRAHIGLLASPTPARLGAFNIATRNLSNNLGVPVESLTKHLTVAEPPQGGRAENNEPK